MSILKKFFGKNSSAPQIWRATRIHIESFHRIYFRDRGHKDWKVGNISTTGVGLLVADSPKKLSDSNWGGEIEINERRYTVDLEVRHQTELILGCRFLGPLAELQQAIESYLNAEILALKMNRIDPSVLAPHPSGQVHWFTDGRANEVHFVMKDERLQSFHISFLGNYLERTPDREIRYGQIIDERYSGKPGHKGSNLIHFFDELPAEAVPLARRIINNLREINSAERDQLLSSLENSDIKE